MGNVYKTLGFLGLTYKTQSSRVIHPTRKTLIKLTSSFQQLKVVRLAAETLMLILYAFIKVFLMGELAMKIVLYDDPRKPKALQGNDSSDTPLHIPFLYWPSPTISFLTILCFTFTEAPPLPSPVVKHCIKQNIGASFGLTTNSAARYWRVKTNLIYIFSMKVCIHTASSCLVLFKSLHNHWVLPNTNIIRHTM